MNPFKKENPLKDTTTKAKKEKEEEEYLAFLDAAVHIDPENKHGQW